MTAAKRTERSRPSDVPLDDRLRYLLGLRFLMAAITVVFAIAAPDALTVTSRLLVGVAVGYVAVTAAAEWLSQRGDRLAKLAIAGMLVVDGVFLTVAVYGTGGSASVLQFLVYLQLLAVSLLGSSRTGLVMAAWETVLFVGVAAVGASAAVGSPSPVDEPHGAVDVRAGGVGVRGAEQARPRRAQDRP